MATYYIGGTYPGMNSGRGSEAAGYVPNVPDPGVTQAKALEANIGNWNQIENLAKLYNAFNNAQAKAAIEQNNPGYSYNLAQQTGNIGSQLRGEVSQSTRNALAQGAAERGLQVGVNSPNANAALLRALGLTSEQLQLAGGGALNDQTRSVPVGKQFDPLSMFIDPNTTQEWSYLSEIMKAAPNPAVAQAWNMMAAIQGNRAGRNATGNNNGRYINDGSWLWNMLPNGSGSNTADEIVKRYAGGSSGYGSGSTYVNNDDLPAVNPGWAETWSTDQYGNFGNYGSYGNVPVDSGYHTPAQWDPTNPYIDAFYENPEDLLGGY